MNYQNLELQADTRLLITGPRKTGKTALLSTIAEGRADAVFMAHSAPAQITALTSTVAEEIALGLETEAKSRQELMRAVHRVADQLGIMHLLDRNPLALSGGQTQLVVLASNLALGAPLLAIDEPLTGLDTKARQRVIAAFELYPGAIVWSSTRPFADERGHATQIIKLGQEDAKSRDNPEDGKKSADKRTLPANFCIPTATVQAQKLAISPQKQTRKRSRHKLRDKLKVAQNRRLKPLPPDLKAVAQDLEFTINPGEIIALSGPNGSGKTTLLRTIAGLIAPASGSLSLDNKTPSTLKSKERVQLSSLAAQNPAHHFVTNTVHKEFLTGGAKNSSPTAHQSILKILGLEDQEDTHPHDLCPVEQHLLAVGTAAAARASCLLLDEPTAGVDEQGMLHIAALITAYADAGGSVIIATHDQELLTHLQHRTIELTPEQAVT